MLPAQASSVPCERLFSAGKETAADRRSRLGAERFEQLQVMKFAWRNNMKDYAAMNQDCEEEVDLSIYEDLLSQDHREANLDIELAGGEPADESNVIIEI